ncbi:unnamed protein product, partial [Symbiodinium pilosum]
MLRIAESIDNSLANLNKQYDQLVKLQASLATCGDPASVPQLEDNVTATFFAATKEDLALNNYVMRSKTPGLIFVCVCVPEEGEDSSSDDDFVDELLIHVLEYFAWPNECTGNLLVEVMSINCSITLTQVITIQCWQDWLDVEYEEKTYKFFFAYLGGKGDWV